MLQSLKDFANKENIPVFFFITSVFFLPIGIKPSNISVILTCVSTLFFCFRQIRISLFQILIIGFAFVHLAGMAFTSPENQYIGWALMERYCFLCAISIFFPVVVQEYPGIVKPVLKAFVWGVAIAGLVHYTTTRLQEVDTNAVEVITINRVYLGMFAAFAVVCIYFLRRDYQMYTGEAIFYLLIMLFVLVIANTKMPIFITLVFLIFFAVRKLLKKEIRVVLISLGFLLAVGTTVYFSSDLKSRLIHFFEKGDNVRTLNWSISWELIRENPWIGVGTGDALQELNKRRDITWFEQLQTYNSHNQYIETSLRTGIFGFVFLIATMAWLVIWAIRDKNSLFFCFLFVCTCSMLTESILVVQKGIFFFGLFASLFWGMHRTRPGNQSARLDPVTSAGNQKESNKKLY